MMRQTSIEKLHRELALGKVVTIVGTGVSVAACPTLKVDGWGVATWPGLVGHGVEFCVSRGLMTQDEAVALRSLVAVGTTSLLINAAEDISERMRESSLGVFRGWLEDTIGKIVLPVGATTPALLSVLKNLPGILATLNYDNLLEAATGYKPVTWDQAHQVQKVLRGEAPLSVLHLHGHYESPNSVVLGKTSYSKVKNDAHASVVLKSFAIHQTMLFVGCGDTVLDPNFARLIEWAKEALADVAPRHYILCRHADVENFQEKLRTAPWLQPLSYGERYDELVPFLQSLIDGSMLDTSSKALEPPNVPAVVLVPDISSVNITKTEIKNPNIDSLFDIYSLAVESYYEVRDLDVAIMSATLGAHLWVSGVSGVGKTAALKRLAILSGWRIEHVILASFQQSSAFGLIAAICTQLYERMGMQDVIVPPTTDTAGILNHLEKIYSAAADGHTLSIFVEEIPLAQGEEYSRFLELVYHITLSSQRNQPIRVIWMFSSIVDPEESINPNLKHFRERMQFIRIVSWRDVEIRRLIGKIKKSGQIKLSSENTRTLILEAQGIPRFVKMVLRRSRNEVGVRKPFAELISSVKKDL